MNSTGCFWCTSTLYGLNHTLTVKPLRCINTLWLGVYIRYIYTPWNMLDIPQQDPLKYGFSGIEVTCIFFEAVNFWSSRSTGATLFFWAISIILPIVPTQFTYILFSHYAWYNVHGITVSQYTIATTMSTK